VRATEERIGSVSALPLAPLEHWMSRYQLCVARTVQEKPSCRGSMRLHAMYAWIITAASAGLWSMKRPLMSCPKPVGRNDGLESALEFDGLVAQLPDAHREVIVMLKARARPWRSGACATSSAVAAVKLKSASRL
jgi:hypothetical protein